MSEARRQCQTPQAAKIMAHLAITADEVEEMRSATWDRIEPEVKNAIVLGLETVPACAPGCVPAWSRFSYRQKNEILSRCRLLEKVGQRALAMR